MTKNNLSINSKEIHDLIPHRYPFLLVDRIEEINGTLSCIGIKNCLLYTSPSPRDVEESRMPTSA